MTVRGDLARPLTNRVTPFGEIIATSARGTLMGNRGCLHDRHGQIVRQSGRSAWITCEPSWPSINRPLMAPRAYTELFFLDEVTALAAGHRPCGDCRFERLVKFKRAWANANGLNLLPKVAEIDAMLALERAAAPIEVSRDGLPYGAMVTDEHGQQAWLLAHDQFWRWSFTGYVLDKQGPSKMLTITPPSIIAVLRAGYDATAAVSASG